MGWLIIQMMTYIPLLNSNLIYFSLNNILIRLIFSYVYNEKMNTRYEP